MLESHSFFSQSPSARLNTAGAFFFGRHSSTYVQLRTFGYITRRETAHWIGSPNGNGPVPKQQTMTQKKEAETDGFGLDITEPVVSCRRDRANWFDGSSMIDFFPLFTCLWPFDGVGSLDCNHYRLVGSVSNSEISYPQRRPCPKSLP